MVCEGYAMAILLGHEFGNTTYFCPSTELILILGGIVVTVVLVGGYILFE